MNQKETTEKLLRDMLSAINEYGEDYEDGIVIQFIDILRESKGNYPEFDKEYIKVIKSFPELTEGIYGDIEEGDSWYWHAHEIVKGVYPLEKLPDHIRGLAEELYYKVGNDLPRPAPEDRLTAL